MHRNKYIGDHALLEWICLPFRLSAQMWFIYLELMEMWVFNTDKYINDDENKQK